MKPKKRTETGNTAQKLWQLPAGCAGVIVSLAESEDGMETRLRDLGFTEGSTVCLERHSPLGDPAAYRIRGALIALRQTDAALVTVCPLSPTAPENGRTV